MGYNIKCYKNTFYGLTTHSPVWKQKTSLGGHSEYNFRFQQTGDGYPGRNIWVKKEKRNGL